MDLHPISHLQQTEPLASDQPPSTEHCSPLEATREVVSLEILRVPQWTGEKWLLHGFSTRNGGVSQLAGGSPDRGDLNLGYTANDSSEAITLNRRRFLAAMDLHARAGRVECGLVTLKQMHSALVRKVGRAQSAERASMWGDGLMTDEPGVLLGVQTADCLPVLISDKRHRAVAAIHAGWRGTLKGIVQNGVESMRCEFHSEPKELTAAIGPGIGNCCFEVGAEVRDLFASRFSYAEVLFIGGNKPHLDLVEANRRQLLAAGLSPQSIFTLDECTSCRTDRFFSYRAEHGKTGRMMAVIGIAPG